MLMNFLYIANLESRKAADVLILPFWKGKHKAEAAANIGKLNTTITSPVEMQDFTGKEGEVLFVYTSEMPEKRLALLGLGEREKGSVERLRRAYASLVKACRQKKLKSLNLLIPSMSTLTEEGIARGVVEGLLLANYTFDKLKHDTKEETSSLIDKVTLIGGEKQSLAIAKKSSIIAEGVYLARDLVNGNADEVDPEHLAKIAQQMAKTFPRIKTTVFNKQRIEKEKMGLLLAVNRGSHIDPTFIIMEYKGSPRSKDRTVVVGKGVTYDTGGLNLKSSNMETMKCDMGGAATALGTIHAVAKLGLPINLTVVIPATENAISMTSYKPGDVYKSLTGKTVEIGNTDAEGRLILADALAYVVRDLKPTRIIDFATLTGAMEISLGAETTGLMSNQDALADALIRAGHETYERLCRFPLYEEYREQLKSDVADIKNFAGRSASSITAALFLKEFVGDVPWAHCDIAGTAFLSEARRYHPKFATGVGVRLMIEFLENL